MVGGGGGAFLFVFMPLAGALIGMTKFKKGLN